MKDKETFLIGRNEVKGQVLALWKFENAGVDSFVLRNWL